MHERLPSFEFLREKTLSEKEPVAGERRTSWRQKWVVYLFGDEKSEKRIDWRGIIPDLLVELTGNSSNANSVLSDMGLPVSLFDVVRECAGMAVEVERDGSVTREKLPEAARKDFLRGARVFLALKSHNVVTPGNEPFEHYVIRTVSELVIREYWRVPEQEQSRLFTELMPLLVEKPGLLFEKKALSTRVARALYSTLFKSMFGNRWVCPCGEPHGDFGLALHPIIERGAIKKLPKVLDDLVENGVIRKSDVTSNDGKLRVLIVGDNIPLFKYLPTLRSVLDPTRFDLIDPPIYGGYCDADISSRVASAINWLRENRMPPHVVIGVGGGVTIDVSKHAANSVDLPLVAVPTALSNDGAASSTSSLKQKSVVSLLLQDDGTAREISSSDGTNWSRVNRVDFHVRPKKSIKNKSPPVAVLVDLDFVEDADDFLTAAGFGDALKFSSVLAARRAFRLGAYKGDAVFEDAPYCPFIGSLLIESSYLLMLYAADLMNKADAIKRDAAFKLLADHFILCAYAITTLGDSSMVSRDEHGASHKLDFDLGEDAKSHGAQVAVTSLLSLRIRAELFAKIAFGITWQDQREAFKLVGTPTSTSELGIEPANAFIETYLHGQEIKASRHTLLCDLHRIFEVQPKGFHVNYLQHLRDQHERVYGSEVLPNEQTLVDTYGSGEKGLRKFLWAMARNAEIVSCIPEEFRL